MPSRSVVLFGASIAFLTGVLLRLDPQNAPHLLIEFSGIALSTFVGAYAAFRLQTKREELEIRSKRAASLRTAQFALVAQANSLQSLLTEHLDPLRTDPDRDVKLKAIANFLETPAIDLASLGFLLESTDPDLLNVLLDCQNKWNTVNGLTTQQFSERRRFLEKLVEVRGSKAVGQQVTRDELRADVGPEISGALLSVTDSLYSTVDHAVAANEESFKRLAEQIAKQFPGERALTKTVVANTGR